VGVAEWLFPKACFGCGAGGGYFCQDCRLKLEGARAICPMCGETSIDGWVHPRCRKNWGVERLIAPFRYTGTLKKGIKRVKYSSSWEIVREMGEFWSRLVVREIGEIAGGTVVTWIPMYERKKRRRGFDQAEILARRFAKEMGVSCEQLIERVRETGAMYELDKKKRAENIRGVFGVKKGEYKGKTVIVVDDVWTTGSTMREAAKELMRRGAKRVWGAVVAR